MEARASTLDWFGLVWLGRLLVVPPLSLTVFCECLFLSLFLSFSLSFNIIIIMGKHEELFDKAKYYFKARRQGQAKGLQNGL